MKLLTALIMGFFALPVIGQTGARFDSYNFISSNSVPFGAQAPIFTLPNSQVTVCAYPDDGGQPCGNVIPVYSNPALTQAADNPIVADVHGRFGFWLTAGTYTYSVMTESGQFAGTYIFTLGGSGGGTGCVPGGTNYVIRSDGSGGCLGDNAFTYSGFDVDHGLVLLNQGVALEVDGIDDSNHTVINGDQIQVRSFGDDPGTTMIPFLANQSDGLYTGGADIIVDFDAIYSVDKTGGKATGFLTEPNVSVGKTANTIEGFHSGAPNIQGTASNVYGFHQSGAGPSAATEEFSFFSETASTANINANYCDFMSRTDDVSPSPRFKLGCGQSAASTFSGPVILTLFTPSSSSAACTAGQIADDTNFHYVCTATNTWKRVALSSF